MTSSPLDPTEATNGELQAFVGTEMASSLRLALSALLHISLR